MCNAKRSTKKKKKKLKCRIFEVNRTEQPTLAIVCLTVVWDSKLQVQIQTRMFQEEVKALPFRNFFFSQRGYGSVYITNYTPHTRHISARAFQVQSPYFFRLLQTIFITHRPPNLQYYAIKIYYHTGNVNDTDRRFIYKT